MAIALWTLAIAGCSSQSTRPALLPPKKIAGIYHVVKAGETLYRIGKAYDLSGQELARINGIRDANQIRVGQRILIPGASRQLPVEIITPADASSAAQISPPPYETTDDAPLWPVSGTIQSSFGPRGASFHEGVDIAAPEGTPVQAIDHGEVVYSDQLRGYGNIVVIRHSRGLVSVYAHNQVNLVREGQQVTRGEVIAKVGRTGRVTGPHLHFEIRKNNTAQDPIQYLPQLCCVPASDTVMPGG